MMLQAIELGRFNSTINLELGIVAMHSMEVDSPTNANWGQLCRDKLGLGPGDYIVTAGYHDGSCHILAITIDDKLFVNPLDLTERGGASGTDVTSWPPRQKTRR